MKELNTPYLLKKLSKIGFYKFIELLEPLATVDYKAHLQSGAIKERSALDLVALYQLVYKSLKDPELKQYREEHKVLKNKLKFDCMLVAVAITRGVTKIYSHDIDLKRFAQNQIHVETMPILPEQLEFFPSLTRAE